MGRNGSQLAVYLGHVDLSERRSKLKYVYKVKQAIMHKDFSHPSTKADIAVLKLEKSIRLTKYTRQVCLPGAEDEPDLENCIAMGWGRMANRQRPMCMQKIKMKLTHKCESLPDRKRVLCAVGAKGKGVACFGDSGGSLICSAKSKSTIWLQYDVSSYSDSWICRGASYYMKVSHYLPWMQKYALN